MLFRLHKLALRLRPFLPFCYALGLGAAALALALILRDNASAALLNLALGLTVWALLLFAFVRLFQSIPPPVLPGDSLFARFWARCKLALYHLLALSIGIVGVVLVVMSMKLLTVSL